MFADNFTIGTNPQSIFINTNNTVYAANYQNGLIQIWLAGSSNLTQTIVTNSNNSKALFVSMKDDIYIDNGQNNQIDVWRQNASSYVSTLYIGGGCLSVFVDTNESMYCSIQNSHKVIKRSLNISDNQLTIVAGADCPGYEQYTLNHPSGVFVAVNFDLYVADTDNNRIQRFRASQLNGTTVAGREASGTMQLKYPTAVMLDGNGYLFIADTQNNRIVGSGPFGFRCLIGCTGVFGSASNQLSYPKSMAFDSYGNIFIADSNNNRVQTFMLSYNSCSKWDRQIH